MQWVLASKSPRRKDLMAMVLPQFTVADAHVDEAAVHARKPALLAKKLARAKAAAAMAQNPRAAVIGCDTVVELKGTAFGKPRSRKQAALMLMRLSGRVHKVHTGVCVLLPGKKIPAAWFINTTLVKFSHIPAAQILRYTATAEPYDKAGGYGIQGWAAKFITGIQGCYYNAMGLPVAQLYQNIRKYM